MATAVELISNKGDRSLGFGANADIPMSYGEDLDVINKTASQLQLMRAAFNKQMFDQKVADRDNMIKAIDEGQIKVGNVLQKDDPVVNKALESVTDAYANMMKGGGLNNIELVRKYKDAVQQAKSTVTQAQTRFADVTGARTALAKETNPLKRERQQKALSGYEASDFWADYVPPQDFQDLNMDEIIKLATPTTTEYNDPKDRLKKIKETRYSFDNVLKKANENYLEDVPRENQRVLLEQLQSLDPKTAVRALDAYNKQLERYSKETGDKPVKIEYEVGPDGRVLIAETLPDLAAKVALASQPQYLSRSSDLDKSELERAKLGVDQYRAQSGRISANASMMRAQKYGQLMNKKLADMDEQEKRIKNFWSGITSKVKQAKVRKAAGGAQMEGDFVFAGDLPKGYRRVGGLDENGKPIELTPKKTPSGVEYYETKFYGSDGSEIDLLSQFKDYKSRGGKGSYAELRSKLLDSGKISMELIGEDGVGDFETAYQTARALSNKLTTKGEEPVFGQENVPEE